MSNRKVTYSLLLSIILLVSGFFLFQNFITNIKTQVPKILNEVSESATAENWDNAHESLKELEAIWNKGKYLVALNYAEPDYLLFIENMARLKNALEEKDQSEVKKNVVVLGMLWENITKVVPLP